MRTSFVAGNWKLNGNQASISALVANINAGLESLNQTTVAVCAPCVYVPLVHTLTQNSTLKLGAQNVSNYETGAYTGEVSAPMLKEFGCEYVIIGHSERRALFGESDEICAQKFVRAQQAGLTPIFCVGETLTEREANQTEAVISRQLQALLAIIDVQDLVNSVVAYEPIWAIGTGKTATPEQAQAVHAYIRQMIANLNKSVAEKLQILYGGSVKGSNAAKLFAMPDIDGGLIGGAALNADEFLTICRAGNKA
ncbi:MAG: triose-phosphate isomerase [Thiofilum sp.]|uniref:triose-phosphate isomerase n=1 Tax=Thiofilum sp. TaxID=2212733 RepID=UPI0025E27870|nr:triose-phosphate isomerase [Thiofilum sp.]MBK8453542.1 triose-phosphate isomerase [Thiofilum sp.]